MISLEKLTEFTHENLGYKPNVKVTHYEITGNWIELQFDSVIGEVVKVDRYYNWMSEKRNIKIDQIL